MFTTMGNFLKKLLVDTFTGPDGVTYEIAHILWAAAEVILLVCAVNLCFYHVDKFSLTELGNAFAALNIAGGIGSWARAKSDKV